MIKTPKEEAIELVEKFFSINNERESNLGTNPFISREYAKQCAIIAVKRIISASPSLPILSDAGNFVNDIEESTEYWEEVLKEIENYES